MQAGSSERISASLPTVAPGLAKMMSPGWRPYFEPLV